MVLSDAWVMCLVVLAVLPQVPAQARLELQRLRLLQLQQLLGPPVPPDVVVEEEVLERPAEVGVVGDALVQVKVGFDDLLDLVLELGIEGQPHVLARVHTGAGVEAGVLVEGGAEMLQRDAVLWAEVQAEALVQRLDDARERLQLLLAEAAVRLAPGGFQRPSLPFQRDPATAGPLDAEGLHVDVLLDLARQLIRVGGQQAAQVPGEDIELFEVGVGEGQHLGEEGIKAYVVAQLAAEVAPLV